jgi:hypothetical protein
MRVARAAEVAAEWGKDDNVEDVRKAYYDLLRWDRRVVTIVVPRAAAPRCGRVVRSTRPWPFGSARF